MAASEATTGTPIGDDKGDVVQVLDELRLELMRRQDRVTKDLDNRLIKRLGHAVDDMRRVRKANNDLYSLATQLKGRVEQLEFALREFRQTDQLRRSFEQDVLAWMHRVDTDVSITSEQLERLREAFERRWID